MDPAPRRRDQEIDRTVAVHVAQAHGGDITVESREGEGSIFRLRLAQVVTGGGSPTGYLFEERR